MSNVPLPPQKKRKIDIASSPYSCYSDIHQIFTAQSESALIQGLSLLRTQLSVKNDEHIQPSDQRLLLAQTWLDEDPGAYQLLTVWQAANARQMSLICLIVAVFSELLNLLSSHYTYHAYAQPILRALFSQQCIHKLNAYLSGTHKELILVTLKLFNTISEFAGGGERKVLLEAFAWEAKSVPKLLHMRRKSKNAEDIDALERPDIRTLYILFVLSFIHSTTPSSIKAAFLEQHRDAFTVIFKGLWQDPYSVIRRVLEVCWSGLWSDVKLKRTLKIHVFNERTLSHLARIYERNMPEGHISEAVPADVVHHFLLALCTRPGVGLCFHDRGWYPRETDSDQQVAVDTNERTTNDDDALNQKGGKIYNKILANVLKSLKVNEDPRQQELALKTLAACPELIAGYWSSVGLALEPRLSSKWLANIAFFGAVVSLPVPTASFFLPTSGSASLYYPNPPPLITIVENILPTAQIKAHLSRGLQAASPLVQHASALALAKCLLKYEQVERAFREVERALEEDDEGLWVRRRREVEREVRRRVPEFQVIVGFSQRTNENSLPKSVAQTVLNPTRTTLLAESAHRLLWRYHQLLPAVVAETRFDTGKSLQAIEDMLAQEMVTGGLDTLRQLHVLRLLKESEHFTWSGKSGAKHSNFHILLKAYTITPVPAVRTAIIALLRHILAPGVLFQHDADEISLWLDSLPLTRRAATAQAPDGAPLTDEGDSVIPFLDDCVQRCMKTPYKYVEELQAMYTSSQPSHSEASSIGQRPDMFPSPLLATTVEQLSAKLRAQLLSPSAALALFSFVRKLLLRLVGKTADFTLLHAFAAKIAVLVEDGNFSEFPAMKAAMDREVALLVSSMGQLHNPWATPNKKTSAAVQAFLQQVEQLSEPNSDGARQVAAYELVDWLRLVGSELHVSELSRLICAVEKFHRPALKELFQYLDPQSVALWEGVGVLSDFARIAHVIDFETLFLHCRNEGMDNEECRMVLVRCLFMGHVEVAAVKRAIRLVLHRLAYPTIAAGITRGLLMVLASIVDGLHTTGNAGVARSAVLFCFESECMKALAARSLEGESREGLGRLLKVASSVGGTGILAVFATNTNRWVQTLRDSFENMDEEQLATALLWFKYMDAQEALALLSHLADRAEHSSSSVIKGFVDAILKTTSGTLSLELDAVTSALPLLCRLQALLPGSSYITSLIAIGIRGSIPYGHDGYLPNHSLSDLSIGSLMPSASKRWALRLQPAPPLTVPTMLAEATLSDSNVDIVTDLLYRDRRVRPAVSEWLASPASKGCSTTHLIRLIFASYDSVGKGNGEDTGKHHFSRLTNAVVEARLPRQICARAVHCLVSIVVSSPSERAKHIQLLRKAFSSINVDQLSPYPLVIGKGLIADIGEEAVPLAEELLDLGLKWAVRHFFNGAASSDDDQIAFSSLASIIRAKVAVKSHFAEPVIAAVVQNRLANADSVCFARLLASSTHFKPVTVNKLLQSVVQHERFCQYSAISSAARDSVIDFLYTLFHLYPSNTCQPSHIEPLRLVYGGSLGAADLKILAILKLFETTRKTSVASLLSQWSTSLGLNSGNALEALLSLEPDRMLRTCLEFPDWRTLAMDATGCSAASDLYDPVFILLLLSQTEEAPTSALVWVQLLRTNVVSLVLRSLSAKDSKIRDIAWGQVASLYKALEAADLQEKQHVLHILNLLKDVLPSIAVDEVPRLPAFTTLLLAHAFRGIFYPSNFIYPLTARFLLQRPTLDPTDVPMLYGMLYSSSDDWKKERAWLLRFLGDAIVSSEEWQIMKRRHTWDLLASLFQSEERDRNLRRGVLEVLANITCHARATTSLILRHALLAWIEMQLQTMRDEEAIAWVRIIENVLAVVDAGKMEAATNGEWRAILGRCLATVLSHSGAHGASIAALPVLLRLSLLPGPPTLQSTVLLRQCVSSLIALEAEVLIPASGTVPPAPQRPSVPLHHSHRLFDSPTVLSIESWGDCIETLWRVSMVLPNKTAEWDLLTCRLLVWRSIADAERTWVGEWARQQAIISLVLPGVAVG